MADAKTIDNLGPEVNSRYIEATRLLSEEEVRKVFQTPSIAKRTEILTTAAKPLESDKLFGLIESESSPFAPPKDFVLRTDIFSTQLVPTLGLLGDLIEKLDSLKKADLNAEEKNQMTTLLKTFSTMKILNEILQEIQKRKDEYHKG